MHKTMGTASPLVTPQLRPTQHTARGANHGKNITHTQHRKRKKKDKVHHYQMGRKVKMKLHRKVNKHGLFSKKTKMKAQLSSTIVSLAKTDTNRHILSQGMRNITLGEFLH